MKIEGIVRKVVMNRDFSLIFKLATFMKILSNVILLNGENGSEECHCFVFPPLLRQ